MGPSRVATGNKPRMPDAWKARRGQLRIYRPSCLSVFVGQGPPLQVSLSAVVLEAEYHLHGPRSGVALHHRRQVSSGPRTGITLLTRVPNILHPPESCPPLLGPRASH